MRGKFRCAGAKSVSSSAETFVEEASSKASWLVQREVRGPGDLPQAMHRIEARYGIPYATLLALRYRKPRDILISVYVRICEAHRAECERQKRLIEHEAAIASARTWVGAVIDRTASVLDRAAIAVVSTDDEALRK